MTEMRPRIVDVGDADTLTVLGVALRNYAAELRDQAARLGGEARMLTLADRADELRQALGEASWT
ncbi:MAG: hypothetical protein KF727_14475 [Microbacteriaceae bacterium]|nr:hypothetical protein [Microbacteriaceae bacterium]